MARNSQGVYTLPAGNPVIADTTIESDNWANPTLEDVGSEITDSLSRDAKGSMRAELGIVNGTASTPGVRFNAETGSGMFRESNGEWGFSRLGSQFLRLGAAGITALKTLFVNVQEDTVQAIVRGNDPQTEDLHQWQDHTGAVLARIDATGKFFGPIEGMPPGAVSAFAGEGTPSGWLFCDGAAVSRTTFASLFTAIGVIYGDGNGSTTFNIPDHRGKFLRGQDDGAGNDPDAATRTDRGDGAGGDVVGSQQAGANEAHDHAAGTLAADSHAHGLGTHVHGSSGMSAANAGSHFHSLNFLIGTTGSGAGARTTATGTGINTTTVGDHSHSISGNTDAAAGDTDAAAPAVNGLTASQGAGGDTRPINDYTRYIIRAA